MTSLPTIEEEDKLSWLRMMWRYRRQFQALSAACLVCVAGGMKLAWSVFESPTRAYLGLGQTHSLMASWFVGVVLGSMAAPLWVQRLPKNVPQTISGCLLVLGGLLSLSLPTHWAALLASCLLEGFAYGLSQVQMLSSAGEVAFKNIRGLLVSSERVCLWLGISGQLIGTRLWFAFDHPTDWSNEQSPGGIFRDQLHGAAVACLGLLSVLAAFLYHYESPLWLQRQTLNKDSVDDSVTHTIKRLLGARYTSPEVQQMRDDCKQMVMGRQLAGIRHPDLKPLLKVGALRCFVALAVTLPYTRTFVTVSWSGYATNMNCLYLLGVCGLTGSLCGGLLIDEQGRRKVSVLSLLLTGIFIFTLGGIFEHIHTMHAPVTQSDLGMAATLMILYEFFMAAGVGVASSVYMAESFTAGHKVFCVAAIVAAEHLVQLLLVLITLYAGVNQEAFYLALGSMNLLFGILSFFFMPETKYLSLYECLLKFHKVPF